MRNRNKENGFFAAFFATFVGAGILSAIVTLTLLGVGVWAVIEVVSWLVTK